MNTTLKQILQKSGKFITTSVSMISLYTFAKGLKDNKLQEKYESELLKNRNLESKVIELLDNKVTQEEAKNRILAAVNRRSESLDLARTEINKIEEIHSNLSKSELPEDTRESLVTELNNHLSKLTNNLSKGNDNLEEIIDNVLGSNSNNFIINDFFNNFISIFQEQILPKLTLDQVGAIGHISISIFIIFCLLSLITIFFSDYFINNLNLEEKYPKFNKFIQLRRKFQQYYFILNSLGILLASITIIYINILVFIYK
jgi:hypothetical protein